MTMQKSAKINKFTIEYKHIRTITHMAPTFHNQTLQFTVADKQKCRTRINIQWHSDTS